MFEVGFDEIKHVTQAGGEGVGVVDGPSLACILWRLVQHLLKVCCNRIVHPTYMEPRVAWLVVIVSQVCYRVVDGGRVTSILHGS